MTLEDRRRIQEAMDAGNIAATLQQLTKSEKIEDYEENYYRLISFKTAKLYLELPFS